MRQVKARCSCGSLNREMPSVNPDVVAAFFAGIGAVLSSVYSIRQTRKRGEADCQRRIDEIHASFREGFELGEHVEERQ